MSYSQWRYDVKCLITEGHPPAAIHQAIRRSVRGTAADILQCQDEYDCPVDDILGKFDAIFGNVLTPEQMYQDF